jgi:cytochrome P450
MAIEGLVIPEGSYIDVDIVGTHLREANWENAAEFDPDRFLCNDGIDSTKDGLKFVPFGYGSHLCIGLNFSYTEQRVFLSMLCKYKEAVFISSNLN